MEDNNTTPMSAVEYDKEIGHTIPYYEEFHRQTIDVIRNMGFRKVNWLDLGCGTGMLVHKAKKIFSEAQFVLADPSKEMLEKARQNNPDIKARYVAGGSESMNFHREFQVVTAIQSHHYMYPEVRKQATWNVYQALCEGGIYITFENVIPFADEVKELELRRWGKYQQEHGKTKEEAESHIARCGVNYFPLTMEQHIELLKAAGFKWIHVFWYSYMQAGLYAIK